MSNPKPTPQNKELSLAKLNDYRKRGAHVLIPQTQLAQMSPLFQVSAEMVRISPNPLDKDVWKLPGGKLGLSKQGLYKIASAAGIDFVGSEVVSSSADYIMMSATVRKRNASGAWEQRKGTYEIDMAVIEQDIYLAAVKKIGSQYGPKNEEEAKKKADEEALKFRRYRVGRCETGAYLRAIRAMLTIKGDYTPTELEKPFIVPAVHFSPDMSNPEMRAMVVNAGKLAIHELWGGTTPQQIEADTGASIAQLQGQREQFHLLQEAEADAPGEIVCSVCNGTGGVDVDDGSGQPFQEPCPDCYPPAGKENF